MDWTTKTSYCSLHTFVDASKNTYSVRIFLRCKFPDDAMNVQLLQTKSQIILLKRITIPHLELMATTTGARLFKFTKDALQIENVDVWFWTDTSLVYSWIKRQEQWSVLVSNWANEIRQLTKLENWFNISRKFNPADLSSRSIECGVKQLLKS